jgi:hypothetical protein
MARTVPIWHILSLGTNYLNSCCENANRLSHEIHIIVIIYVCQYFDLFL